MTSSRDHCLKIEATLDLLRDKDTPESVHIRIKGALLNFLPLRHYSSKKSL